MVTIPTTHGRLPEKETFSWTVLTALAGEVEPLLFGDPGLGGRRAELRGHGLDDRVHGAGDDDDAGGAGSFLRRHVAL